MKNIRLIQLLAVIFVAGNVSCNEPNGFGGLSSINGKVLINDTVSDKPYAGAAQNARVDLYFECLKAEPDVSILTNEAGEYSFFGLMEGTYCIRSTAYRQWSKDSLPFSTQEIPVEVESDDAGYTAYELMLAYEPSSDLLIKVMDKVGDPLPGVPVYLFNNRTFAEFLRDSSKAINHLTLDTTRQDGSVFKRNMPSGTYYGVINTQLGSISLKGFGEISVDGSNKVSHLNVKTD